MAAKLGSALILLALTSAACGSVFARDARFDREPEVGVAYRVTWCSGIDFKLGSTAWRFNSADGVPEPTSVGDPPVAEGVVVLSSPTVGVFKGDAGGSEIRVSRIQTRSPDGCL